MLHEFFAPRRACVRPAGALAAGLIAQILLLGGCTSYSDGEAIWRDYGGATLQSGSQVFVDFDASRKNLTDDDIRAVAPALARIGTTVLRFGHEGMSLTDASLDYLRQVVTLKRVVLSNTLVTSKGLRKLKGMPALELVVVRSNIDAPGDIAKLRSDLSSVKIELEKRETGTRLDE